MNSPLCRKVLVLFVLFLFPFNGSADTLELLSGQRIVGQITGTKEEYIYIETTRGTYRVRQDRVKRIIRDPVLREPAVRRPPPRARRSMTVIEKKRDVSGLVSIGGHLGISTFNMGSANDAIANDNQAASNAGFSGSVPNVPSGYPLSFDVRYGVWKRVAIGLDLEYLQVGTKGTYSFSGGGESLSENISAYDLSILGAYVEPLGDFNLYGGVGLSLIMGARDDISTHLAWGGSSSSAGLSYEQDGIGMGGLGLIGIEYLIAGFCAVGIEGGYRWAPVYRLKASETGQTAVNSDGSLRSLDLSGIWVMGGIRFYFRTGSQKTSSQWSTEF